MAFNLSTAKPIQQKKFDLNTARPIEDQSSKIQQKEPFNAQNFGGRLLSRTLGFPPTTAEKIGQGKFGEAGRDVFTEGVSPLLSAGSTAAFGIPRILARKAGVEEQIFPEQTTPEGKRLRVAAEAGGLVFGGAAKLAGKAGGLVPEGIRRGAVEGGVFGLSQLDVGGQTGVAEEGPTVGGQLKQAGIGTAGGALLKAAGLAKKSLDRATVGAPKFLKQVRGAVFKTKAEASERFGQQLDDLSSQFPDKRISIRDQIDDLIKEIKGFQEGDIAIPPNPKLRSLVNRTPELKKIVDNPQLADDLGLRDVQNIINGITSKFPGRLKTGAGVNSDELPLLDLIDDIRFSQLESFPQMAQIRQQYGEVLGKYNLIKNRIREASIKRSLVNKFGDSPELQKSFDELIPKELRKEIDSFRNASNALKTAGFLGKRAVEGAGIFAILRALGIGGQGR